MVSGGVAYVGVSSFEEGLAADPTYVCCSFRGSAVAVNLSTGAVQWKTYTVPEGYSGGAVWSSTPVVDVQRDPILVREWGIRGRRGGRGQGHRLLGLRVHQPRLRHPE